MHLQLFYTPNISCTSKVKKENREEPDQLEITWLEKDKQENPKEITCTYCKYLYTYITCGYQPAHGRMCISFIVDYAVHNMEPYEP